jgi:hypothetical protein
MGRSKRTTQQKSSRKSKQKQLSTERRKKFLERMISKGIFEEAKRAEQFGPHPGFVSVKLRLTVYNAMNQREMKLPGKGIELLVSSIEEVDDLRALIERTISQWINGEITP